MKAILLLLMLAGIAFACASLPARYPHHYSETGVLYTTTYLTLRLPDGVVGFAPGSRLQSRFDVHVPDMELVTDGKYTLALDPQTLTHDVEYAQDLAETDQQEQDQIAVGIEQTQAGVRQRHRVAELLTARDLNQYNASMVAASSVGDFSSSWQQLSSGAATYDSYGSSSVVYYPAGGGSTNNVNVTINQGRGNAGFASHANTTPGKVAKVSRYGPQPLAGRELAGVGSSNPRGSGTGAQ